MFQKFTVLFVGYSHDDPIMRYLALGLPSATPRYAFTDAKHANDAKWVRLGVSPISYPVVGEDHGALVGALEAWGSRARMGQLEHRARVREIVDAGANLTPVDRDYLLGRIQTVDGARDFVRAAASCDADSLVEWLHWIEALPEFQKLFRGDTDSDVGLELGNWFSQAFIAVPRLHGEALHTVQRLGQSFSEGLFSAACWATEHLSRQDASAGERWRTLLATSVQGRATSARRDTLLPYSPGEHPVQISVLRAVLRPHLALKPRWNLGGADEAGRPPDAEVQWGYGSRTLAEHVLKAVETVGDRDVVLGTLLEDTLNAAYDLLDAYHGERSWDRLSFRRSAIEPHAQDEFRDPIDAVIDGLRTYGEKVLRTQPELPERWWSMGRALYQRLALHLLAIHPSRTADRKLEWLLDKSLLYAADLKHEVYRVIRLALGGASPDLRARLLAAAQAGPDYPHHLPERERRAAYARYNLLVWLTDSAPDWTEAATLLKRVQAENSTFAPRDHPDFDRWMTGGTWGGKLPMEPEDFIRAFQEDAAGTVSDLLGRNYSDRNFGEPDWNDALRLVRQVSESRAEVGYRLWGLIEDRTESVGDDLRSAIVDGWAKGKLGDNEDEVIRLVALQATSQASAPVVSRFLLEQVRIQIDSPETTFLMTMREVANDLWRQQRDEFTHSYTDPVSAAPLYLNSWPGDLAQYWLSEIDRRWRQQRDDWSGFNDEERAALASLLEGPPQVLDATRPAFASQLFFMFAADPDFTTEYVLPLFREDATAKLAWVPYLYHPRYNDRLLAVGLRDCVLAEWNRLDELERTGIQDNFFGLVASIVSFAGIDATARQSLLDQTVLAGDGSYAADFAEAVSRLVRDDGVDGAEIWTRWLRQHVTSRIAGLPRLARPEELARWADIVPYLGIGMEDALELLNGHEIGLGSGFVTPEFPQGVLGRHGQALVAHYAERVRNTASSGYWLPHVVSELIEALRPVVGDAAVQPLVEAAMERGLLADDAS
jgi:hypothetical protein